MRQLKIIGGPDDGGEFFATDDAQTGHRFWEYHAELSGARQANTGRNSDAEAVESCYEIIEGGRIKWLGTKTSQEWRELGLKT